MFQLFEGLKQDNFKMAQELRRLANENQQLQVLSQELNQKYFESQGQIKSLKSVIDDILSKT